MKITTKLTILLLIAGLLPLVIVTYMNYNSSLNNMTQDIMHNLTESLNYRTKIISKYTTEIKQSVKFDATSEVLINRLKYPNKFLKSKENKKLFTSFLEHQVKTHHYYKTILISCNGDVINSSLKESDLGTNLINGLHKNSELAKSFRMSAELRQPYISNFSYYAPSQKIAAFAISPIFDNSKMIGAFCFQLNIDDLYSLLEDYDELGETGEIIIASKVNNKALFLNPIRNDSKAPFKRHVKIGSEIGIPIQEAVNGGKGNGIYDDYQEHEVIATWGYIPDLRLGMVLKIDTKEAFEKIVHMRNTTIFIGLIALAIFMYVLWLVRRIILKAEKEREQYEFAINGINDGLWDWNLKTDEIYFSPRGKEIMGYKNDDTSYKFSSWKDNIHPDDLEKILQAVKDSHSDKNIKFNQTHRLKHKDGHWVWILARGQTIFDNNGKPVRMTGFQTDITKTKKLEKKLRTSKQQFESFMENIPANIIIKDKDRRIIYANSVAKSYFNANIIGLKSEDILSKEDVKTANRIDDYIDKHGFIDNVSEYTNYNNEKKVYHTMGFLLKDKKIGVIIFDKTQEIKSQQQVKQLGEILENSTNEVYIFSKEDLKFLYVNKGAKNNIGYSLEEMTELTPIDIKLEMTKSKWDELVEPLNNGSTNYLSFSTVHKRKNGTTYPVDIYLQMIIYEGEEAYVAFIIDTTQREKIQKQLKDQEEIMISQSRHAAMGEMISMIAHQWRQPISIIGMGANNIIADIDLDMVDNDTLKKYANDITVQTKELSNTIDDFRNFFKPNKDLEEVFVEKIFKDSLSVIGKSLTSDGIEVILNIHNNKVIKTYPRELMQVFINMLKNAKEALVENTSENRKISIIVDDKDDGAHILICDNAGGIKDDIINKIFNPYFSTKNEKNGTGLGLYMSKTIIEKHLFGTLKVYNEGAGACFEIKLPYNKSKGDKDD